MPEALTFCPDIPIRARAQATPLLQQPPIRPGEYTYEPKPPKIPVTQDAVDQGAAKACR